MKKLIYSLGLALAMTSCASDYLDTTPESTIGTSTIFENTDNAKLAVNGLSRMMTAQYLDSQGYNGEGTIKTYYGNYPGNDFQKCAYTGWSNTINGRYHERADIAADYYPWYYYYKIIGNANTIILNIDAAEGLEEDKMFIKAQALTFRAYCYMMLSQLYCHRWVDSNNGASRGLPLRLDDSTGDLAASTLGEVYAQIYQDLDDAIANFKASGQDRDAKHNYETNLDVAYAVYARAALTRSDWQNAANYAALARKNYSLMTNNEYNSGFNTTNQEWIWSVYSSQEETLYYYQFFAYQGSNSSASVCRTYPCAISKELYDKLPESDMRRSMWLSPQSGETYNTTTGKANSALEKRAKSEYASKLYSTSSIYVYMQFKFQALVQPGVGELNLFRAAEMYLTEAEANCHLGGKDAQTQALLVELNKTRNPDYTCTKTGNDLLEEVKLYRKIELWGEGFDWFDYKRWKEPISRKTFANGGSFHAQFAVTVAPEDENQWTWVYPNREINYNGAINENTEL
jgi:hypothetical protein